jgi:geranylgeranyl reductase family protein
MTETTRCDVLIIGGGPAGASCARALKQAGLDVRVLDKSSFPRDKVCAGWVTPQVLAALDIDTADYARGRVLQPISGFRTGLIGNQAMDTDYDRTISYGIRRCEFDHYLLQHAGVPLLLGEPVRSLQRNDYGWRVNDHIETRLLIGAGGHFCPVAQHLGARTGRDERAVFAQETEFAMSPGQRSACRAQGERPELYFCNDLKGYGWVFRKDDYLNIGLGREDREQLSSHVDSFIDWLRVEGRIPPDIPGRLKGHAYLLYRHGQRKRVGNRVLLIGDAAGLAYTQSGEGIRPAIESGLIAARLVAEVAGDYSGERLAAFSDRLVQRFGEIRPDNSLLPAGLRNSIGRWLLGRRWFTRHIVLDDWFLHRRQTAV